MKVLLAGATGLVGGHLLEECLYDDSVEVVHVVGRNLERLEDHPKLRKHEVPFEELDSFDDPVDNCFCCLGTTIKKAKSKEQFKKIDKDYPLMLAKRFQNLSPEGKFLIVTAMGADSKSSVFYNKVKGEIEEELKKLGLGSLLIFRPSLLLGDRSERRFLEGLGQKILPFLLAPKNYRPILGFKVAKKMLSMSKLEVDKGHVQVLLNGELSS